jgi:hypothetical protein
MVVIFICNVHVLLIWCHLAEIPLAVRGEIFQIIWVKNAPDIFRIKSLGF